MPVTLFFRFCVLKSGAKIICKLSVIDNFIELKMHE